MQTLHVNPRFAKVLRAQNKRESDTMAKHLAAGVLPIPIFWWLNPETRKAEILDGQHRHEYGKVHGVEFPTHEVTGLENEDQAEAWIIYHQFSQRNVDDWAVSGYLSKAVALERANGATKREAIVQAAEQAGVTERTVYRALEEETKSLEQQFFENKKVYERDLERVINREVEKLKQRARREGWDEDESRLESEWGDIEAEIQKQFADVTAELESVGEAIQGAAETMGHKPGGKRRSPGKNTRAEAARRNGFKKALTYIAKFQNDVLYFWDQHGCGTVDITDITNALKTFAQQIGAEQEADAKAKKKKFGR